MFIEDNDTQSQKNSCRIFVQLWRIEIEHMLANCNSLIFCVILNQKIVSFSQMYSQNVLKSQETLRKCPNDFKEYNYT